MSKKSKEEKITETKTAEKPRYTKDEEIFNAVTHIVGGGFGVIALVLGIIFAAIYKDGTAVLSMTIYGVCMIVMYTMSSLYHFLRPVKAKKVFRIFDHCSIYLLIAGTYTPYCLITLNGLTSGYIVFGVVWLISIVGIIFNAINMKNKFIKTASFISYILLGWCAVFVIKPLIENLSAGGLWLLIGGGIAYTGGAVFYLFGKKAKYIHSVWHLFVLLGTILQFLSVLLNIIGL